jgi:hypothetical protein
LAFSKKITLWGKTYIQDKSEIPIQAKIEVFRDSPIPGKALNKCLFSPPKRYMVEKSTLGEYSLTLIPNFYNIAVTPLDESSATLPPIHIKDLELKEDTYYDFVFEKEENLILVSGKITRYKGTAPIQNLNVRALDPEKGWIVSTTSLTDSKGDFEIFLDPQIKNFKLRIAPTKDNPFYPTLEIGTYAVPKEKKQIDIGVISFPPLKGPYLYKGIIQGMKEKQLYRISEATVIFKMKLQPQKQKELTMNYNFEQMAISDAQGNISLTLLGGEYQVKIIPPPKSEFASYFSKSIAITSTLENQRFTLSLKHLLKGKVFTPQGSPIEGLIVEAIPALIYDKGELLRERSASTITNKDGSFVLPLNPQVYYIYLKPPENKGLAWTIKKIDLRKGDIENNFTLNDSNLIFGQVQDASGAPMSEVTINIFHVFPSPNNQSLLSLHLSQGKTDENGNFYLLIPYSLAGLSLSQDKN